MTSDIFVEKYRPTSFNNIKSQKHVLSFLQEIMKNTENSKSFLFYGNSGIGKTTSILAFAKSYYGENYKSMIMELNASDYRGINTVNDIIDKFANTSTFFVKRKKLVILDEFDSMTVEAQMLLIDYIENSKNIFFCFICNYVDKIIEEIRSSCLCFKFKNISLTETEEIISNIAEQENIKYNKAIVKHIYKFGNGDIRKCINIFQDLVNTKIKTQNKIYQKFNCPTSTHLKKIISILQNSKLDLSEKYKQLLKILKDNNISLKNIVEELTIWMTTMTPEKLKITQEQYLNTIIKLGDIDYYLSGDYNEIIQIYAIISYISF